MFFNNKMILPKLWVAAVPRIWNAGAMPTDYPQDTNSVFSVSFATEEQKSAVIAMESSLNTEKSVITEEMVPEHTILGNYLGTYDLVSVPGELTLLSPEPVGNGVVGVVALHYVEPIEEGAEGSWEKIEDAHVVDGYAYGTLDSFSPVAVFTVKRDTYLDTTNVIGEPAFVCNGIPVIVSKNDEGKVVAVDANGKETEIAADVCIVGGTIDGSEVESASVTVKGGAVISGIIGSSICLEEGKIHNMKSVSILVEDSEVTKTITGGNFNVRLDQLNIHIKNSKAGACGAGESIIVGKDSNKDVELGLGANCWVKNANTIIENSEIGTLFAAGNCGLTYIDCATLVSKDSKFEYAVVGGSNGLDNNCHMTLENCESKVFQTVNRGHVKNATGIIKDCKIDVLAVLGDPTDKTVNGVIDKAKVNITGGSCKLYVGTYAGEAVEADKVAEIVEYVKISRSTVVEYIESADVILGEKLRIK